jgi:hypothetical protein
LDQPGTGCGDKFYRDADVESNGGRGCGWQFRPMRDSPTCQLTPKSLGFDEIVASEADVV